MKVELKSWTGLGLATALVGAGLAGCSGEGGEGGEGEGGETAQTAQTGEAGEGEGGESGEGEGGEGEGGEGGVAFDQAASDPVVYGSALAVAEAHAIAAKDAFAAGKTKEAGEMFAHPVSEVLADMAPAFKELGVDDFKPLFGEASTAALDGASAENVATKYDAIIAALRAAAEKAPDNGSSDAAITAGIAADQIERAIAMYKQAAETDEYAPYLDGYGFSKAAAVVFEGNAAAIQKEDGDLHAALSEALALLAKAYPSVERPDTLNANQGALTAAGSKVLLAL
ncbi:MAG: hypothetical protein ABJP70_03595 [Erythrobacter sp.]